jgi:hypothetical protein
MQAPVRAYLEREFHAIARSVKEALDPFYERTEFEDDDELDERYPPYSLLRYLADPTGAESSTTAFNRMIAACIAAANHTATVQHGQYLFSTAPDPITQGVMIVAPGSQGSNEDYGTAFIFDYDTANGLEWNGNGAIAAGTGGGLQNVLLNVGSGRTLGDMLKLLAVDDDHRPGEFQLRNVLAGASGGEMTRFLHVDGTAATTPSTKGVRTLVMEKVRCAKCATANQYIYLNQAVHVYGDAVQIDQAGGSGAPGMTIAGDWEDIFLSSMEINGSIVVGGTGGHMMLAGHVSTLDVNSASVTGSFSGSAASVTNAAPDFRLVTNCATAWRAVLSADSNNLTGNGAVATVAFNAETFDRGGNHSAGVVTVTQAGLYKVDARINWKALTASVTRAEVRIVRRDSGAVVLETATSIVNPSAIFESGGTLSQVVSEMFFVNEGDTFEVQVFASGLAGDTVGVTGSGLLTTFSGKLLA